MDTTNNFHRLGLLAGLGVMLALMLPGSAAAHVAYPQETVPPEWWTETLGPKALAETSSGAEQCVPHELFESDSVMEIFSLFWGAESAPADDDLECSRTWGNNGDSVSCAGEAYHMHYFDSGSFRPTGSDGYSFSCQVFVDRTTCSRDMSYNAIHAPGEPDGIQSDDTGWKPRDCRRKLSGWPNNPGGASRADGDCAAAKKLVKKAKRAVKRADSRGERREAERKLRKARKARRAACG
jgi:hypothetical protein